LSKPAQVLAVIAIGREFEKPNNVADIIAPIDPIRSVGFLPIRSLILAH
jgi:hypothetical protein